jgi:hypothetical protein
MRPYLPDFRIINGAIGGTGIIEADIIAPRRFNTFEPDIFIYQIYIGNDLINISPPVNWSSLSVLRNIYWSAIPYFRSLAFLNFRFGQLFKDNANLAMMLPNDAQVGGRRENRVKGELGREFAPEKYNLRNIIMLKGDPDMIEDTILVKSRRKRDFETLLGRLGKLLDRCDPLQCRAYVLIVPHASQSSEQYLHNMLELGARFSRPTLVTEVDYPFVSRIRDFLNSENHGHVEVLNPLKRFQQLEADGPHLYFQNDPHLNDHGQKVLADFLIDNIQTSPIH